jgi:hypothetical protein
MLVRPAYRRLHRGTNENLVVLLPQLPRRTGSTYGIAFFYRSEDVRATGETSRYDSNADSGQAVTLQFCPKCGSTVFWEPHRKPGLVAVALGSFADPTFPAPTQAVNAADRHPWVGDPVVAC